MTGAYRGDGAVHRDRRNVLDCAECGSWFPSFQALATHIHQHEVDMAKRAAKTHAAAEPAARTTRAKRPPFVKRPGRRSAASGRESYPPFVTADDLRGKTRFQIQKSISIYQRDDGATSLFLGVMREDRETFTWSVRCGSPDRISLQSICGRNLIDWPGKVITLYPQDGRQGGRFVNLHDPDRQQSTQRTSSARNVPDDDIPF